MLAKLPILTTFCRVSNLQTGVASLGSTMAVMVWGIFLPYFTDVIQENLHTRHSAISYTIVGTFILISIAGSTICVLSSYYQSIKLSKVALWLSILALAIFFFASMMSFLSMPPRTHYICIGNPPYRCPETIWIANHDYRKMIKIKNKGTVTQPFLTTSSNDERSTIPTTEPLITTISPELKTTQGQSTGSIPTTPTTQQPTSPSTTLGKSTGSIPTTPTTQQPTSPSTTITKTSATPTASETTDDESMDNDISFEYKYVFGVDLFLSVFWFILLLSHFIHQVLIINSYILELIHKQV